MSDFVYLNSPIGWLLLTANEKALERIDFSEEPGTTATRSEILQEAVRQLGEYFTGSRQTFDLPLHLRGTPFQQQVWSALLQVPYGQTASYKDIAQAIGNPKAVRAVGLANGRNPIPIIVPCHRIIGANGQLVGYSSGLWRKEWLLKHERSNGSMQHNKNLTKNI